jgi:membrane fusion protein
MGWLFFGYASAVVVAIVAFTVCGHYTRRVRSEGRLAPSSGLLTIVPPAAGVVTHTFVHEGDAVTAGQPLLEVTAEQGSAEYGGYHEVTASQLKIKREKLQDDLREENRLSLDPCG